MGLFRKRDHLGNEKQMTVIAVETEFKGKLDSQHTIQVDGLFEGIVTSKTRIIVSESGKITGEVNAEEVYVYGRLVGQITAEKVMIGDKGHINATIISEHLVIMEGGHYIGEKREKNQADTEPKKRLLNDRIENDSVFESEKQPETVVL